MGTRLELQNKLEELLGCKHVYYQAPESVKMEYPAIRYSRSRIDLNRADDTAYLKHKRYELVVISRKPDEPVIEQLLELPYCSFGTSYKVDNLYHDTLVLYF